MENKIIPFRINYPLEIFDKSNKINFESDKKRNSLFIRSLFYNKYGKVRNNTPEIRNKIYLSLAKEIVKFMNKKYPKLEIQSISIFGSALYSENPKDFDFLVIVKGNSFLLEEIELFLEEGKNSIKYSVGISIKGEDNLSWGIFDINSKTSFDEQNKIINRTGISLFKRHIPLIGYDFKENEEIFKENIYAQISDLLSNTYNLYYKDRGKPDLNETQRARKILSRIYEAISYLESIEKDDKLKILRKDIYLKYSKEKILLEDSKNLFDKLNLMYLEKVNSLKETIDKEISFKQDEKEFLDILNKTKNLLKNGKIGNFLPVVSKIVDKNGKTISFAKRIKKSGKSNIYLGSVHAEINAINSAKFKGNIKWGDYTLYCSLEPCGACTEEISKIGIKKVVYCIADPLLSYYGRKRELYDKNKVSFYRHNSSELIFKFQEIYEKLYSRKESINKLENVLEVLREDSLKKNINERLEKYWKNINLPYKWINPILNTLLKYSYNEDIAVNKVRKKFPGITNKESINYSKKLREFRSIKVKNLAERIKEDISGDVIVDVGGRSNDFIEQILLLKKGIKKAYVTDIDFFSSESKNHKIKFIIQESNTKIPFKKNSINTFILSMVLHHLKGMDQRNLIKNIASSLKEKGKVILIEDSYPGKETIEEYNRNITEFLKFNTEDKKKILSFYDWFGNRLMRNRDNMPLFYRYRSMEEWKEIFEGEGLIEVKSEFIHENLLKPDIFPPKAILIFKKIKLNNNKTLN
jgi:deoxycytidylate deaminase/SAM-dependent methyltransferase